MKSSRTLVVLISLVGCGPSVAQDSASAGGDATTSTTATSMSSTTGGTTISETGSDGSDEGANIIELPDCGFRCPDECDPLAQDCSPGTKCTAWAIEGEPEPNMNKCVPVDPDPRGPGESCTVEGYATSGVDDCDVGLYCFNVDPDTLDGTCATFCAGRLDRCPVPCEECAVLGDGVLPLCLPTCDPVLQTCAAGQGCYPLEEYFYCMADASGPGGGYGDACETLNDCDRGLFCVPAQLVPDCPTTDCCVPACDLDLPMCPDQNQGVACLPWFDEGGQPETCADFDLGVCVLPPP